MSLRDDLEREVGEAAQRIPLVLQQTVYGVGQTTDDPIQQLKNVLHAQMDLNRIYSNAILRLADEIDGLRGTRETPD
jgi:hypothetical protein